MDINLALRKEMQNVTEIKSDELEICEKVGWGTYGEVFRGKLKSDNQIVAVKITNTEHGMTALRNEAHHLSKLTHDNIVKMHGVCYSPFSLVSEYMNGYTLFDVVHAPDAFSYDTSVAVSWCLQCAKGVEYLHSRKPPVIHRDLKSINLLLDWPGKVVKIIDFGNATDMRGVMTNNTGTPNWMAPEVIRSDSYTEKCDVYSFAIILWETLYQQVPFKGLPWYQVQMAVADKEMRPPLEGKTPKILEELIQKCWEQEPEKRPSMNEVVKELSLISEQRRPLTENCLIHLYDCCGINTSNVSFKPTGYSTGAVMKNPYSNREEAPENVSPSKQSITTSGSIADIEMDQTNVHTSLFLNQATLQRVPEYIRPMSPDELNFTTIRIYREHVQQVEQYIELSRTTTELQQRIDQLQRDEILSSQ